MGGDLENDDLRQRFSIDKEAFPAFILFKPGDKEGEKYTGTVTADMLSAWLRKSKIRMPTIGTIEEMDVLAKKFLNGFADEHMAAASKLAEGEYKTDKKAAMYVRIMGKIKEKGEA